MTHDEFVDAATAGYLTCAEWADLRDEDGESVESGSYEWAPEAEADMKADMKAFIEANFGLVYKMDPVQVGHDFWLTRNGHGTGFWDRGLGEVGKVLTEASKPYGEASPFLCDDGLIRI